MHRPLAPLLVVGLALGCAPMARPAASPVARPTARAPSALRPEVARIQYLLFPIRPEDGEVDPAEVRAWMEANPEELEEELAAGMEHFVDLPPLVRSRHLLATGVDDAARLRAERWLERLRLGERFEVLARSESDDPGSARRGGDLGYGVRGRWPVEYEAAVFDAPIGLLPRPVRTRFGYHVVEVLGRREGDVPIDEARVEVATQIVRWDHAAERGLEQARWAARILAAGEDLPAALAGRFGDDAPPVERSGLFLRDQPAFPFADGAVARAAFTLSPGAVAAIELEGGSAVVVHLLERRPLAPAESPPELPDPDPALTFEALAPMLARYDEMNPTIGYRRRPSHLVRRDLERLRDRRALQRLSRD